MTLLVKKDCSCPLDYLCHTFRINIVLAVDMELVLIVHIDCCVVITAVVGVAGTTADNAVGWAIADFVGHYVAFVVIIDSAVVAAFAVAAKETLTLFAVDIVVTKMTVPAGKAHPCLLDYPYHIFNRNFY